jgi:hypothetical protein
VHENLTALERWFLWAAEEPPQKNRDKRLMDTQLDAFARVVSPQQWIESYATRLVELSAGKIKIPDDELHAFALNCARGGYPAFWNDDPAECAEAEFLEWRMNSL